MAKRPAYFQLGVTTADDLKRRVKIRIDPFDHFAPHFTEVAAAGSDVAAPKASQAVTLKPAVRVKVWGASWFKICTGKNSSSSTDR